jgi:type I restriction enzyme R subunit
MVGGRGVIEAAALYDRRVSNLHAGGPEELFAGHQAVIDGILEKLRRVKDSVLAMAG